MQVSNCNEDMRKGELMSQNTLDSTIRAFKKNRIPLVYQVRILLEPTVSLFFVRFGVVLASYSARGSVLCAESYLN